eukprot:g3850.t1
MKAVRFCDGILSVALSHPVPQPKPHEALIRVTYAGICSTDLEILQGYIPGYNGILGHEFCGVVEKCSNAEWTGKRVCGSINILDVIDTERPTEFCLEHHPKRTVLGIINKDGCFAEYLTLPISNLIQIPDNVTNEEAVFIEPLAAALRIREQVQIQPSVHVAVLGAGKLGMLIGKTLQFAGTSVCMKTRSTASFDLPQRWGLDVSLIADTPDDSYAFVVEATGSIEGFRESLRIVKPLGTIILKSTFAGPAAIDLTKVVVGEIKIVGSRCGPFHPAMRILQRKEIPVTDLINSTFPLTEVENALSYAKGKGVRKVLLKM